ncbi:MAG TPA: glycosyltransferase family 9 protein [Casimicrobiaceae bacterium]|nr:glycosyltransferase family 9 protein [Casimicrobiaceae bacterium]
MATATAERPSRFSGRAQVITRALLSRLASGGRRSRPVDPERILIAHHLLLGDTLMLTPLVAKLRERHPAADLVMALPEAYAPLYARAPYGLRAIGWDPRHPAASPLWRERGFDLALIPGDNRFSWLALALDSRWIVAFADDRRAAKSWPVDESWRYPTRPAAWGDMVAGLIDGAPPAAYHPARWPAPFVAPMPALPARPYAVLHVGASTPLKCWDPGRWATLASRFAVRGIEPVWSAGCGEEAIVRACDPEARHRSFAGALSLPQIWHLLAGASILVSPDTGIAHLGRVVGTPTVVLFGPGSATITGGGAFWRDMPYRAVTVDPFPCRDQRVLFKREIAWVRRCGRSLAECPHPRCMDAISVDAVAPAIASLGIKLG